MAKWGRAGQAKIIIQDLKSRDYVCINGIYYPPNSKEALAYRPKKKNRSKIIRTGWVDDTRNTRNKEKQTDPFIQLVLKELNLEVWPEFYFSTERQYRIDYAIPSHKIAIEVDGGIWMRGNSGHSSGTGIKRDMEKGNLLQSLGWKLIRVTPQELMTNETIELIKSY